MLADRYSPASTLITAPAVEPISLAEAKLYLKITHSNDDALISALIAAARQWIESYTRRALCTQTIDFSFRGFPCSGVALLIPSAPLVSVTSVKYYDENGTIQTWDAANYNVRTFAGPRARRGHIEMAIAGTTPNLDASTEWPVIVRAVCGYGDAADVPEAIKAALYLRLGDLYEQRQESIVGTNVAVITTTAERLLAPFRLLEAI